MDAAALRKRGHAVNTHNIALFGPFKSPDCRLCTGFLQLWLGVAATVGLSIAYNVGFIDYVGFFMSDQTPSANVIRHDSRAADALRPVHFELDYSRYAEGSVLIQMGHTHVLCNASVLDSVPPFLADKGQGWVTAEYGMLPRATHTRSGREAARGRQSGRTQEIQRLIGRSLRAAFDLSMLGERTIQLDCDVLQADGGTRCASITGAWVAAALAVNHLLEQGALERNPLQRQVAAVSVGLLNNEPLLDLDYEEDVRCDVDVNIVMNDEMQFIEVQGTAEGQSFARSDFIRVLDVAQKGIAHLFALQQKCLHEQKGIQF